MTQPAAAITTYDDQGNQVRRYPIPHPDTGEIVELPNISSVIAVLHAFGLDGWKLRNAAVGIVHRLDLQAAIAAGHHIPPDDRGRFTDRNRALNDAIESAIAHGQCLAPDIGYLKNDFGTSIHLVTDLIDDGAITDVLSLPASIAEHAEKYARMVAAHGVTWTHSEVTVWGGDYAGTGDRFGRFTRVPDNGIADIFDGLNLGTGTFVFDTKSGKVKKQAALQLAALANARTIFDAATGQHLPMPDDMRTDIGFIIHLERLPHPDPDTGEQVVVELVPVDLDAAWPAFQGALAVKRWDETKPLHAALVAPQFSGGGVAAPADGSAPLPDTNGSGIKNNDNKVEGLMDALVASVDAAKEAAADQRKTEAAQASALLEGCDETPTGVPAADAYRGPDPGLTAAPPLHDAVMDEPTHISEPLKDVIAAIPDEPLDDDIEQRATKTAWLVGRLTTLVEHGDANIAWPADVPTFPQARDRDEVHTLDQLEQIERAIAAAERQVAAPFPDRDPTDPTAIYVAADDPRVADIHRRFEALPPDLKAACGNQVTAAGVRRFSIGAGTEQCVTTWHQALDTHEAQAAERASKVELAVAVLTDAGIGVDVLVATVGNYTVANAWQADRLDDLADCATAGVLTVDDDGRLWVDADQVLGNWGGSKRPLLAAAKTLATQWGVDKPSKADDALAHPLLAAALLLVDLDPNEAEPATDRAATTAA